MPSWGAPRATALAMVALVLVTPACGGGRSAAPHTATPSAPAASPTATPSPTPTAAPPTATATPAPAPSPSPAATCTTTAVLATWSVRRLAEQTVVVPVDESDVAAVEPEVAAGAGGVLLFGSVAPPDLGASLAALSRGAPDNLAPLVMSDEEGGAIQRMANLAGTMPAAREMGATMTPAQIQALAAQVGQRMRAAGVGMDLAPVLDLDAGEGPNESDADGTRSFSVVPDVATADGLAFAAGMESAGVVPVVKHFPGLGGASGNTDAMPASTLPWDVLQTGGLTPFTAAVRARVPAVMVTDATVPGLTTLPASLSPAVITGVLRNRLGFGGLVLTDTLSAVSVSAAGYSVAAAAAAALAAGADMVLFNGDAAAVPSLASQTVQRIVDAVSSGALSRSRLEDAVLHVLATKRVSLCG